jgi:carotenoid 1,2-hydratase
MLGNVFSPFYAAARALGPRDPRSFSTMHVAARIDGDDLWSLTERPKEHVASSPDRLAIGPSTMRWDGNDLEVRFLEREAPFGRRLSGTVKLHAPALHGAPVSLAESRHTWWPIAPFARATVELERPRRLRFEGSAYADANAGTEPLERGFSSWSWSRVSSDDGAVLTYDVVRRDGSREAFSSAFDRENRSIAPPALETIRLDRTTWGLRRETRLPRGARVLAVRPLLDAPFYARTQLELDVAGERRHAVTEALSLDRFRAGWVKALLPFRMRRAR